MTTVSPGPATSPDAVSPGPATSPGTTATSPGTTATSPGTTGASIADIEYHYDTGNEFYSLWLGDTLAYSAGCWDGDADSGPAALDRAQRAKFDHHLDLLGTSPGRNHRLLDVGCGWGGLLTHALTTGRVHDATGLTLSSAQAAHVRAATERLGRPGLRVAREDWQDHRPEQPYDGVVSVGAFEHFATADATREQRIDRYRSFFAACHGWLRPGGRLALQTIAYDGVAGPDGPVGSFVLRDVFPGGTLPRLAELTAACDPYFSLTALTASAEDYARTLHTWSAQLGAHREEAQRLVGEDVVRRYRLYLRACEITFRRGACTLYRIGLRRRDEPLQLPA